MLYFGSDNYSFFSKFKVTDLPVNNSSLLKMTNYLEEILLGAKLSYEAGKPHWKQKELNHLTHFISSLESFVSALKIRMEYNDELVVTDLLTICDCYSFSFNLLDLVLDSICDYLSQDIAPENKVYFRRIVDRAENHFIRNNSNNPFDLHKSPEQFIEHIVKTAFHNVVWNVKSFFITQHRIKRLESDHFIFAQFDRRFASDSIYFFSPKLESIFSFGVFNNETVFMKYPLTDFITDESDKKENAENNIYSEINEQFLIFLEENHPEILLKFPEIMY